MEITESEIITFHAICNFVNALADFYEEKFHPLKLYKHLLSKTAAQDSEMIRQHIGEFKIFCDKNREQIKQRDYNFSKKNRINFSKKVYIDLKKIMQMGNDETREVIWEHIFYICARISPFEQIRENLKKIQEEKKENSKEIDFLSGLTNVLDKNTGDNPAELLNSVASSGILTNMVTDLQSGNLDIGKLMGTVQGMLSTLMTQGMTQEMTQEMTQISQNLEVEENDEDEIPALELQTHENSEKEDN